MDEQEQGVHHPMEARHDSVVDEVWTPTELTRGFIMVTYRAVVDPVGR